MNEYSELREEGSSSRSLENAHVNPRFHTTSIEWNVGLTRKISILVSETTFDLIVIIQFTWRWESGIAVILEEHLL